MSDRIIKPTPLVSVVIPCYGQAAFLPEAIESALAQEDARIEVIVVDDGSPDDASVVAARYPVACIRQDNRGLAGARNSGLRQARGEFVTFLDADDRLLPGAARRGLEALEKNPDWAFTFGAYQVVSVEGVASQMNTRPPLEGDPYRWLLRHNWIGMHATVLFRREILEASGGFDDSLCAAEDYEVYLRIARQYPIGCHEAQVAEYRRHASNMSNRAALMLSAVLQVLDLQWPFVTDDIQRRLVLRSGIRTVRHEYVLASARDMARALMLRNGRRPVRDWLPVILRHGPLELGLSVLRLGARLFGFREVGG